MGFTFSSDKHVRAKLTGNEYTPVIDESLFRKLRLAANHNGVHRVYWEEIPPEFRASEERIRGAVGAMYADTHRRDALWLKKHLTWAGCGRAVSMGNYSYRGEISFIRCSRVADDTGFCKAHKKSAYKDGKISWYTRISLYVKSIFKD